MRHWPLRGGTTSRRGEIWLVDLLDGKGHEQQGRRPAIIVGEANGLVIAIPLTTNLRLVSFDSTMYIEPDRRNRLTQPSVAMIFQIMSLDDRRFIHRIGVVEREQYEALGALILELLGL